MWESGDRHGKRASSVSYRHNILVITWFNKKFDKWNLENNNYCRCPKKAVWFYSAVMSPKMQMEWQTL